MLHRLHSFEFSDLPRIAFGPVTPGWGSWEWVGEDLAAELSKWLPVTTFEWDAVPECDLAVVVKHPLTEAIRSQIAPETQLVYCPIDHYGSSAEIDADAVWLRRCARIVIHCERLRKYFTPYAPVEYLDHHVKFMAEMGNRWNSDGPILWAGVRSNLPPLVDWVNSHRLVRELLVLTNPEDASRPLASADFGFRNGNAVRVEAWTAARHVECLSAAVGVLDIKGNDFRQRHKPPAKAIDFIASGLPLAMNASSSPVEHLARIGFDVAAPEDVERWFSEDYRGETERFGAALRELLSRERVARKWRRIISEVFRERQWNQARVEPPCSASIKTRIP